MRCEKLKNTGGQSSNDSSYLGMHNVPSSVISNLSRRTAWPRWSTLRRACAAGECLGMFGHSGEGNNTCNAGDRGCLGGRLVIKPRLRLKDTMCGYEVRGTNARRSTLLVCVCVCELGTRVATTVGARKIHLQPQEPASSPQEASTRTLCTHTYPLTSPTASQTSTEGTSREQMGQERKTPQRDATTRRV